ncbi:MAG: hypothetical protein KatS3mg102_1480 [Planctomycetota bacterium]|nr:MAG: hypothetical protein KatS3mg102_1480 [Planctomycetota bacterium]
MIRSMTGFGRARFAEGDLVVSVLVRALNHRGLKLHLRLPDACAPLGPAIERAVRERIERGSIYLELGYHGPRRPGAWRLDRELLKYYVRELGELQAEIAREAEPLALDRLAALPGVIEPAPAEPEGEPLLAERVMPVLQQALAALVASREAEGQLLARELERACARVAEALARLKEGLPGALAAYRERLEQRLARLLGETPLDPGQIAREVALLAERSDVSEELSRLEAHLGAVAEALARGGPVGRRLEFLTQELQREATTLAAKLQDPALLEHALVIKIEVGRMREQAANVE